MSKTKKHKFASRAGEKLEFALDSFSIDVKGLLCADFGCSTGGFTDCLLQRGAARVYSVDTGYGILDWKLRIDERVVVLERTNAMHVQLPEKMGFISVDVSWTRLEKVLPNAFANLVPDGIVVALLKPHYEASLEKLSNGHVDGKNLQSIVDSVKNRLLIAGFDLIQIEKSPILGEKGQNVEYVTLVKKVCKTKKS